MDKKNLLILGAGQYGQVVQETAQAMGCFEKIGFLDDSSPIALGKLADYQSFAREYGCAFVAMGNPALRIQWLDKLEQVGYEVPVLIHPKAYVSPSAQLGKGCIVEPMSVVHTGCILGKGCLICAGAVVNHASLCGDCVQIDCNATVAANTVVPSGIKVPSGTVYQNK